MLVWKCERKGGRGVSCRWRLQMGGIYARVVREAVRAGGIRRGRNEEKVGSVRGVGGQICSRTMNLWIPAVFQSECFCVSGFIK